MPLVCQAAAIQKENNIYYEYIDPIITPYRHRLDLRAAGINYNEYKTLGKAESTIGPGQARSLDIAKQAYDPAIYPIFLS
jgi:hypothetical protein